MPLKRECPYCQERGVLGTCDSRRNQHCRGCCNNDWRASKSTKAASVRKKVVRKNTPEKTLTCIVHSRTFKNTCADCSSEMNLRRGGCSYCGFCTKHKNIWNEWKRDRWIPTSELEKAQKSGGKIGLPMPKVTEDFVTTVMDFFPERISKKFRASNEEIETMTHGKKKAKAASVRRY